MTRAWAYSMGSLGLVVVRYNDTGAEIYNKTSSLFEALPADNKPTADHIIAMARLGVSGKVFAYCQWADLPDAAMQVNAAVVGVMLDGTGKVAVNSPGSAVDCQGIGSAQADGPTIRITLPR